MIGIYGITALLIVQRKRFEGIEVCELSVLLNNENVFNDAVYARADGDNVIVKGVLGDSKVLKNCTIVEVDINSERLILDSSS